jgi:hypothetical protein
MSDELIALQDTATQARAKADELKAALTEESSTFDDDKTAAAQADTDATAAESAFADAKAKADADAAAAQGGAVEKAGDVCTLPDGTEGVLADQDGALVCVSKDKPAIENTADASRTGFAEKGLRAGDACTCPDGRTGTVHQYDAGLICMPNETQG